MMEYIHKELLFSRDCEMRDMTGNHAVLKGTNRRRLCLSNDERRHFETQTTLHIPDISSVFEFVVRYLSWYC